MRKPFILFLLLVLGLSLLLFLLPINLFDGVIIYEKGLSEYKVNAPLSLSYFVGIGYDKKDMEGIVDFYLTWKGKLMVVLFLVGLPALIAYRFLLGKNKK